VTQAQQISRRSLLAFGGSLLVIAPLLAACGSPSPATSALGVKKVTTGTVRWLTDAPYKPSIDAVLAALAKDSTLKLTVDLSSVVTSELPANWRNSAITGGEVDLLDGKSPKFQFLDPMLKANVLAPMDDYYALYGWDKYLAGAAVKHTIRDGKKWMVPLYLELPGLAYRPSVLAQYGLDAPPQTWEEFKGVLQAAKDDGKIPLTVGSRGFSFVMLLQNMFWAAGDAQSIEDVIFGDAKWTDGPFEASAAAIVELWKDGLIDPDATSIDLNAAGERFLAGDALMNVTGTWYFATMQSAFGGTDWDLMTPPAPNGGPMWSLGEDESMVLPNNSKDPDAAAALLNYLVAGDGAKVYTEQGNLMATNAAASSAIPQAQALPTGPDDQTAVYLYGWLAANASPAWQNGSTDLLTGAQTPAQYAQSVQTAWEQDIAQGLLPENRAQLL
jgi:ABC-type glycerol-3-phosphate transport system substrate-binding protein